MSSSATDLERSDGYRASRRLQAVIAGKSMLDGIKQLAVREQPRAQAIQRQPTHCLTARRCYYSPAPAWPEYIAAFVLGPVFWYTRQGILFNFLPNLVIWHLGVAEPYVRRIDRRL